MSKSFLPAALLSMPIGRQWILVHVLAQLICLSVAFAADGIARMLGAEAAGAGKLAFMLTLATEMIYIGAYAWMRGEVLRRVLPDFPIMLWCAVIAGAMLLFAWLSGFATAPKRNPVPFTATVAAQVAILGSIMGMFMGLVIGTIEALVIRRAARGALVWVLMTMVAWAAVMVTMIIVGVAMTNMATLSTTAMMAIGSGMKVVSGLIMGLLTLPALLSLTPRRPELPLAPAAAV